MNGVSKTLLSQFAANRNPFAVDLDARPRHDVGDLILAAEREPEAIRPLAGRAPENLAVSGRRRGCGYDFGCWRMT